MMNLLNNTALLSALQQSVDDAEIQEQADEILEAVMTLDTGEYEQLHDVYDAPVVRVYRTEDGFNINSVAFDVVGNDIQAFFKLSDYDTGYDPIENLEDEDAAEERSERRELRLTAQAARLERALARFERIEQLYQEGAWGVPHPYLTLKNLCPDDIRIEYSVVNTYLFQPNVSMDLLIYKLSDDAYQVITSNKIEINGKLRDKFNIIRHEGAMTGAFAVVGEGEPEFIVEGLADAITANMVLNRPVAVGINAGNIKQVAVLYPELILIGDNDDAGRMSATQSGLDAIFCVEHKDIDDMRQDKGARAVRRFLGLAILRIERDRQPLLGDSGRTITLVSAPPGTGKSYFECQRIIQSTGLTVYAVHDKKAMAQENSRISMIRDICSKENLTLPTIRRVNDEESESTVLVQFNSAVSDYKADVSEGKNWVVFITHKGLGLLDFNMDLAVKPNLVIDEVPDAFKVNNQQMSASNLQTYLGYFDTDVREFSDYYIVTLGALNRSGQRFYYDDANKRNIETSLYWKLLNQTLMSRNHANFLHVEKGTEQDVSCFDGAAIDGEGASHRLRIALAPKVTKCEVFDSSIVDAFNSVRLLSDDCENSLLALLLKRTQGVEFNIERMASRHAGGIAHRIDRVLGITEQSFSKHKLDTRPQLSNHIAKALENACEMSNSLWLLNNASRENGDAIAYLREQGHEIDDCNPMTHGRNDLTRFNLVVMMYSLKPNPVEVALMENLGVTRNEITRWREHNIHMQNAFRCFLRNPDGGTTGTLVFPDKASIEYFLDRVEFEWGEAERALVEAKVTYLSDTSVVADFESKTVGRKCEGDTPLTPSQKNKLSRWRKAFPELNQFANSRSQGLKGLVDLKANAVKALYLGWKESMVVEEVVYDSCMGEYTV